MQVKDPKAINAARTIVQSSNPTKRSMHIRTYMRRITTRTAAAVKVPVRLRMKTTLFSSKYSCEGGGPLCPNCRGKITGIAVAISLPKESTVC